MSTHASPARGEDGPRGSSTIANVFEVLRCFTVETPEQGVTEIAGMVGLHKSSVSRLLASLEAEGIVKQDPGTRRYRLGLGLIDVAAPMLAELDVRRVGLDDMVALCDRTQETVALTVWDGAESVTVEQVPSPRSVKHTSPLGSRYSTEQSASVQVFRAEQDEIPPGADPERIAEVRARGYAINDGETFPDEAAVAAPVRDHRGQCVAALMLAAPRFRVSRAQLDEHALAVRDAAHEISKRLGWTGARASRSRPTAGQPE